MLITERHEKETNSSHYLCKDMDRKQNCSVASSTIQSLQENPSQLK